MSFVSDMFSANQGAGFKAQGAPLQQAVTPDQTNQAYQNTQQGLAQQQAFVNALQAQNGIGNQSNVYNQYQGIANGTGPNPAQAMLNQSTANNTANQAALMASQRGSSANTGLMTRQAAQQGAANQQNAIGQGASMQAQQSLGALGQMGSIAGQQVGQQSGAIGNYNQFAQGQQQNLLNGVAQFNNAQVGMQSNMNNANAQIAQQNAAFQQGLWNNNVGSAGQVMSMFAEGGEVGEQNGPSSQTGQFLNRSQAPLPLAQFDTGSPKTTILPNSAQQEKSQSGSGGGMGSLLALLSQGGMTPQNMKQGGKVPGQGKVAGDSYANDTIPAMLSPKEIVLPRSVTMGSNAPEAAKQFVINELRKQKGYAEGGEVKKDEPTININMPDAQNAQSPQAQVPTPEPTSVNPNFMKQGPLLASNENPQMIPSQQSAMTSEPETKSIKTLEPNASSGPQNYALPQAQPSQEGIQSKLPTTNDIEAPAQEKMAGIQQEAQAKGNLGQAQAGIAQQRQQQLQEQLKTDQQWHNDLLKETNAVAEDYKKGEIKPNHIFENMSTFGKVKTAIGLLIGGMQGSAQGNPALKYLQTQIDRDIEAQKANLDKNNNLLAANFKKFGNMQDAMRMTQAMQSNIYASQLDEAAAKAVNPLEKARAQQASAELKAQIQPMLQQIKVRNTLLGQNDQNSQNGIDPAVAARFLAPQDMQKEALKEVGEYQSMQKAQDNLLGAFDKLDKLNTISNRVAHAGATPPEVSALRDPLLASLSKDTAGKFTDKDAEYLGTLFPSAGDSQQTIQTKKQQMQNLITQKMNFPTLKSIGVNVGPKEYANRNTNVTPRYQTSKR